MLFDGLSIFYSNLMWFNVLGTVVSWLAFGISTLGLLAFKKDRERSSEYRGPEVDRRSLQTQYKLARQKLVKQNLTPDQISKEKEAEAQQLAAILKLLQKQRDTFKVDSMDELEDQLRLYRN